jgi:hypothetical protein
MTHSDSRIRVRLAFCALLCVITPACGSTPPPTASTAITAGDLIGAYATNEVAAAARFDGTWVDVSGIVSSIGLDILKTPYVTLGPSDKVIMPAVQAIFTKGQDEAVVATFTKGQALVLRCQVSSKLVNVLVRNCQKR